MYRLLLLKFLKLVNIYSYYIYIYYAPATMQFNKAYEYNIIKLYFQIQQGILYLSKEKDSHLRKIYLNVKKEVV